jgi:hypothetical protein
MGRLITKNIGIISPLVYGVGRQTFSSIEQANGKAFTEQALRLWIRIVELRLSDQRLRH